MRLAVAAAPPWRPLPIGRENRRIDDDRRQEPVGVREGQRQRHAAAEGVADQDRRPAVEKPRRLGDRHRLAPEQVARIARAAKSEPPMPDQDSATTRRR